MVSTVAVLEIEVRGEDERVEDEAYCVVEPLVFAKAVMTAIVDDVPQSHHDTALKEPVKWPCYVGEGLREVVNVIAFPNGGFSTGTCLKTSLLIVEASFILPPAPMVSNEIQEPAKRRKDQDPCQCVCECIDI
ncbi:hypothetical protein L1987_61541 [Smallanthus sonchifolius]|uniref:Uncharacterized protein n=1 Tax=Smallanthus sonchifolius TaxID=185202 RepID=A0ACB9C7Y1_9ASTR|nr:hypothetical protein L1987_61541 [Smallanthus sonchifolius]